MKCAFPLFLLFFPLTLWAQEGEIPELLQREEAIRISIRARLSSSNNTGGWESEVDKYTIPGRSVTVHFSNERARLSVHFTPYRDGAGSFILVVRNELWIRQKGNNELQRVQYSSMVRTISLDHGEPIQFYPLGKVSEGKGQSGNSQVELGLSVWHLSEETTGLGE